ncbi:putative signal recognition particle, SRP54 subunit, GTPase domain-containing protein [Helianthus anomalus]
MNTYKYINKLCLAYKKRHTYVPIVWGPIDGYLISNRTYRVAATKRPLLFIGTGEHMDEFELIEIMCNDLIWDFVCWVDI